MGSSCSDVDLRTSARTQAQTKIDPQDTLINILRNKFEQCIKKISMLNKTILTLNQYFLYKDLIRGNNFEGKWNGTQVRGIGIYHKKQGQQYYNAYLGTIQNRVLVGRGLQIKIKVNTKIRNRVQLDFNQVQILYLENWAAKQNIVGCYIRRNDDKQQIFTGSFTNSKQLLNGTLKIVKHGLMLKKYEGEFKKNKFHGKGALQIPSQYKFKGQFQNNERNGLGIEENIIKKYTYIGEFKDNQKDGYGQIIYKSDKSIKLKGFWKQGIMLKQNGVFLDQNSQSLGVYQIKMGTM